MNMIADRTGLEAEGQFVKNQYFIFSVEFLVEEVAKNCPTLRI